MNLTPVLLRGILCLTLSPLLLAQEAKPKEIPLANQSRLQALTIRQKNVELEIMNLPGFPDLQRKLDEINAEGSAEADKAVQAIGLDPKKWTVKEGPDGKLRPVEK